MNNVAIMVELTRYLPTPVVGDCHTWVVSNLRPANMYANIFEREVTGDELLIGYSLQKDFLCHAVCFAVHLLVYFQEVHVAQELIEVPINMVHLDGAPRLRDELFEQTENICLGLAFIEWAERLVAVLYHPQVVAANPEAH